ncbi:MAG: isoprenylcysteine carboxylmethyltransferase family protein [Desulfobacterales bacterium]|nr:isoprenylcysteine carboxylmethyltransferase family protein [Desulfobacterales bacterium]
MMKNIILHRKIGKQIRGKNIEATISIAFFAFFIGTAIWMSFLRQPFGKIQLLNDLLAMTLGFGLLFLNLAVSGASLMNLKDSWRVGVIEDQKTELVTTGIYRFTRNPYFVSYFLMFAAYTVLLQNLILFGLSILGFPIVHKMVMKEEKYLYSVHGDVYAQYKTKVPRYLNYMKIT